MFAFCRFWFAILPCLYVLCGGPGATSKLAHAQQPKASNAARSTESNAATPSIEFAEPGIGGTYKLGYWTPVRVRIQAGQSGFEGFVECLATDGDGVLVVYRGEKVRVEANQTQAVWCYAKVGRNDDRFEVRLRREGEILDRFLIPDGRGLASTTCWVLELGRRTPAEQAARLYPSGQFVVSRIADASELPDRWHGYEGLNAVLVTTSRPGLLEQATAATALGGLKRWVTQGGRIILSAGQRAPEVYADEHPLAAFRVGTIRQAKQRWTTSGIESYGKTSQPLRATDPPAFLAEYADYSGYVDCFSGAGGEGDDPVVIWQAAGLGAVANVAVDIDQEPFLSWNGTPRMIARLVEGDELKLDSVDQESGLGEVRHIGYTDMIGQLRGAMDQFAGVTSVRFSWVVGLIILYVVMIGPLDYLLLRKLQRWHWTWMTFPLIVVLMCGLAILLAQRFRGDSLKLNQVEIVDMDVMGGNVRGTTWAHVYSPRGERLQLSVEPGSDLTGTVQDVLLSWQGLPGSGLGGLDARSTQAGDLSQYQISLESSSQQAGGIGRYVIRDYPVPYASTRSLVARWNATGGLTAEPLESDSLGILHGTFTNPLSIPLNRPVIFYGKWAFRLGSELQVGAQVRLDDIQPLDARWVLTRRRVMQTKERSTPWDHTDVRDVHRILEMMMTHRLAGGTNYTRLDHDYQAFVDLSDHLRAGRAILVGRATRMLTEIQDSGRPLVESHDQQYVYYRLVYAVNVRTDDGLKEFVPPPQLSMTSASQAGNSP